MVLALALGSALACGGAGGPTGPETAPRIASVIVTPGVATIGPREQLQFTADVRDANGRPLTAPLTWEATGGSIDGRGIYVAGLSPGEYQIRAIGIGRIIGLAKIRIDSLLAARRPPTGGTGGGGGGSGGDPVPAPTPAPDPTPDPTPTPTPTPTPNPTPTPTPDPTPTPTPDPTPTPAPAPTPTPPPAPRATTLTVTPTSVTLRPSQAVQFAVDLRDQFGKPMGDPIAWTATGGTVTSTGFYAAGSSPGVFQVVARAAGLTAQARVEIEAPPAPAVNGVVVRPGESIQAAVDRNAAGTTFVLKAGVHRRQSVEPKDGMTFVGEPGAVLDGEGLARFAFGHYGSGSRNVTIRGFEIRNYMTQIDQGAIQGDPTVDWVVEDNDIHHNGGFGIRGGRGMKVLDNHTHHNGDAGIHGYRAHGMLVEGNEVDANGDRGVQGGELATAAGMKFFKVDDLVVRNNYVHHNGTRGIWTDTDCYNVLIEGNRVVENGRFGIWHEISYKAVIRNNHVERNGWGTDYNAGWLSGAGIAVTNSPDVEIYGNTLIDNMDGIAGMDAAGYVASGSRGAYELRNLWVHDNTITLTRGRSGIVQNVGSDAAFTSRNNRFDRNRYTLGSNPRYFAWRDGSRSESEWRGYGLDVNGAFSR